MPSIFADNNTPGRGGQGFSTSAELKNAFKHHLTETKEQIKRLEK